MDTKERTTQIIEALYATLREALCLYKDLMKEPPPNYHVTIFQDIWNKEDYYCDVHAPFNWDEAFPVCVGQTPEEAAKFAEREYLRHFAIGPENPFVAKLIVPSEVATKLKILRGSPVLVITDEIRQQNKVNKEDKDEKETQKQK